jgi:hypothetical protein
LRLHLCGNRLSTTIDFISQIGECNVSDVGCGSSCTIGFAHWFEIVGDSGTSLPQAWARSSAKPMSEKRRRLVGDLSALSGTRVGLARVLQRLAAEGYLTDASLGDRSTRTIRRDAQLGIESAIGNATTPYGSVIQNLDVNGVAVEVVNPFAFVHFLCSHIPAFSKTVFPNGVSVSRPMVMYIDEVRPGNPLRPDKGRLTYCIYWIFVDLPDKLLVSDCMWLLGTVVRTTIIDQIPGKVSGLCKAMLRLFFLGEGHSWQTGVAVPCGNGAAVLTCHFRGFLGDEKALKEVFGLKGAGGTRPCPNCANVVQFLDLRGTLVGIGCPDRHRFTNVSDAGMYHIADRLRAYHGPRAGLDLLEQTSGVNFEPNGVLFDDDLREFLLPVSHYLRDWMHVIAVHGAGGTELAFFFHELIRNGFTYEVIQRYMSVWTVPHAHPKIEPEWFSPKRVGDDNLRVFASEFLCMVPLLEAFVADLVAPTGLMPHHVESLNLLARVVGLLRLGPTQAANRCEELKRLTADHHEAYVRAYGDDAVKPKWHHMLHLHEQGAFLGRILSCFVTERKNKFVKQAGTWTFNSYEHTLLRSLLHQQVLNLSDESLYRSESLSQPQNFSLAGLDMERAVRAKLVCGGVRRGDLVAMADRSVAEVVGFVTVPGVSEAVYVQARPLLATEALNQWVRGDTPDAFSLASDIVAVLVWAARPNNVVRILVPEHWRM